MKNIVGIDNLLDTMDTKELFDWLHEEAGTRYTGTIAGYICDLRNKFATLTEQLRLANEDADRLAKELRWECDVETEIPNLDAYEALHLHEERIGKER